MVEAERAIELFRELKAELDMARGRGLIAEARRGAAPAASRSTGPATPPANDRAGLSPREIEVLRLVAADLNSQVIAERLFVSEHTVHRHIANIFRKLSVSSRAAAVAKAARRGLLG